MAGDGRINEYGDEYLERCFTTWFTLNQPNSMERLQEAIPESPTGKKPSITLLKQVKETHGWIERADALTALAVQKNDEVLVNTKAEMLKRQAEDDYAIAMKAKEHILENGFDTSSSAVSAYFKAVEDERTARGVSQMMVEVSKLTPENLEKRALELLRRSNEAVDAVVEDMDADERIEAT
jgi:hypothetical protein